MRAGAAHFRAAALSLPVVLTGLGVALPRAHALSIELKDVAADRVDRQRSFQQGALPLPGTPNVARLDQRLREAGVTLASSMYIRIFKTESELEVWKEKQGAMVLLATYPICHWSGSLGPKLREGDKQAPEGFYTVTKKQLRHYGRWPRSLLINFPNVYDQAEARTGSDILIHGGCTSVGCYAMTNPVSDEIHRLTTAAIDAGQPHVPIHIFPFRMTEENMRAHQSPGWQGFWANLKEGYDTFEAGKRVPRVAACDGRYRFSPSASVMETGSVDACQTTIATIKDQEDWLAGVPPPPTPLASSPVRTAAADITPPMRLGVPPSISDAGTSPPAGAAVPPSAELPEEAAKPDTAPIVRCRFALRVCRKTATLPALQAARKATRFAYGLKRVTGLTAEPADGKIRPR